MGGGAFAWAERELLLGWKRLCGVLSDLQVRVAGGWRGLLLRTIKDDTFSISALHLA
eukprot:SAG31_NODE_8147_length_1511_cov_1.215297_3_plen_56_part_01